MKRQYSISFWIARVFILAFFGACFFQNCANPLAPQGGPRDTLPPVVVDMRPAWGTTNFTARRIFIEFDEYIKLKDQQKEFYTSPMMVKKPSLLIRGKGIQIDIQDTLAPNTTYSLNFGSSIEDNNEGNPFYSFRYVFSTGDEIDSMVMSGYAVDAYKKDSMPKTFIFFYAAEKDSIPDYDSMVFNAVPDAVARAENNGIFIAENLKPINYRVYAMQDMNGNQQYEPGIDNIGFLDSIYNPASMPGFDVWYDTIRKYVTADPQLYFRMFKDDQFKRQYLSGQSRPLQHKAILNFGAFYPQIDSLTFFGIDDSSIITEYLKPTRDSIAYWFNVPSDELPDTIKGQVVFMRHDSINNLERHRQELSLPWRAFVSKEEEKERERREKERQQAIKEGREPDREPNPFQYTVEASSVFNPENNIALTFEYPLITIDSANISLTRLEDERMFRVRYEIEQDTLNLRRWIIKAPWVEDQRYKLEIPEGALMNVAGQSNDTLAAEFTVMNAEKYATVVFNIKGKTPESKYVLQLTDAAGNRVIREVRDAVTGKYTFKYLDPGGVRLRVIEDMNGNGEWDKGNLVERIQPERVEVFVQENGEEEISIRTGWEFEFNIDMNELFAPITMQSVIEQIRKSEAARMRKLIEDLEKSGGDRNRSDSPQPSRGAGASFNPTSGFGFSR